MLIFFQIMEHFDGCRREVFSAFIKALFCFSVVLTQHLTSKYAKNKNYCGNAHNFLWQ
jgi:hypothetical protein